MNISQPERGGNGVTPDVVKDWLLFVGAARCRVWLAEIQKKVLSDRGIPMKSLALIISIAFLTAAISASFSVPAFSQTPSKQSAKSTAGKKRPCSRNRNVACY
jgi:hypothetical protein